MHGLILTTKARGERRACAWKPSTPEGIVAGELWTQGSDPVLIRSRVETMKRLEVAPHDEGSSRLAGRSGAAHVLVCHHGLVGDRLRARCRVRDLLRGDQTPESMVPERALLHDFVPTEESPSLLFHVAVNLLLVRLTPFDKRALNSSALIFC